MAKEPKPPHKPKRGGRTSAKAGEAEYLIGIGAVGYTGPKGVFMAEVHRIVAAEAGAWTIPKGLEGMDGDVSMEKPRAGACYRYIGLKDIVHEES